MTKKSGLMLINIFCNIEDPRKVIANILYPLEEILFVAFATLLSGGENYTDMHDFGQSKLDFFKTILPFKNGIPSDDTYERVFGLLNPKQFEACLSDWINSLRLNYNEEIISLDGKTARRTGSKSLKPVHMVSAWANKNRLVLGCKAVDEKSNEITAIPEVLKMLSLKGTIVTIDAMGCQTAIAEQIVEQGGDFIISLKGNQGDLHNDVKLFFEDEFKNKKQSLDIEYCKTLEKDHGRIEKRQYGLYTKIKWLKERHPKWGTIKGIGFVVSKRIIDDKVTEEIRYFITTLKKDVNKFAYGVRSHWGVENSLHNFLDVALSEDYSRVRNRNAATNLCILRRMVINKVEMKKEKGSSKRRMRLRAGWDDNFLKTLLFQ